MFPYKNHKDCVCVIRSFVFFLIEDYLRTRAQLQGSGRTPINIPVILQHKFGRTAGVNQAKSVGQARPSQTIVRWRIEPRQIPPLPSAERRSGQGLIQVGEVTPADRP